MHLIRQLTLILTLLSASNLMAADEIGFSRVAALFAEHCLDCHAVQDPEAKLVLESYDLLMKGGESGPAILPGKSEESLLVKMLEGKFEKDGKTIIMPPGRRKKLTTEEIAVIRGWIDSGASAPADQAIIAKELVVPKITPKVAPRRPVHALAYDKHAKLLALGRVGEVEIHSAEDQAPVRTLAGHAGNVNAVVFSADGKQLFAAGGENAISGEVKQWNVADGTVVRTYAGHKDSIYALALSPDGKMLATGSYDQKIKLWNTETGEEIRTLSGHNGCIYGLSFRPDGKILASASGDRTVKLWDPATGERRDTLSQPLKELYTVEFAPDGKRLAAAGVDNRIRVWEISEKALETTNPLLYSKFAHEGAILRITFSGDGKFLVSSAEDKTVKLWEAADLKERLVFEPQADWAPALAFILDGKGVTAGRLDGSITYYNTSNGSALQPPKAEVARLEPRGIQRGVETKLKIVGKHLQRVDKVKFSEARVKAELLTEPAARPDEIWIKVTPAEDLPRAAYDLTIAGTNGESAAVKLYVDDIPQLVENRREGEAQMIAGLPATIWGTHETSGDMDPYAFEAKAGETIVFDAAAKSIGSKADLVIDLQDSGGRVLASSNGFDSTPDPLLVYQFKEDGKYTILVKELVLGGSDDHFYRISMGTFPFVTAAYPLAVSRGQELDMELIGYNLPPGSTTRIKGEDAPELKVAPEPERYRTRREFKVVVSDTPHILESEPNHDWKSANSLEIPAIASGRIHSSDGAPDEDWFRFDAKAGQTWVIETAAAQIGSPLDTRIEVMDKEGKPVLRRLLQAVRDSAVTFRGIDSTSMDCRVENWEEMELNQYLYLQGEVVRLFRAPQGPDSGFLFYGLNGKRRNYFDTTATAHANAEPCYIVEPHAPGSKLAANGLPVFPVYFQNDDDSERKLGTDSKLYFTAPVDGTYYIRVTDTRNFASERHVYRLTVREAQPDFKITLGGANPSVAPDGGQSFNLSAERMDGFDGEIKVELSGLPAGFTVSTPIVIQSGHVSASGTINAAPDAPKPSDEEAKGSKVAASANIGGKTVTKDVNNLGTIKLADSATLYVSLEPAGSAMPEITIAPGQTVPARLKIHRNGHTELVTFAVDNLPHGIIVDNIGLNGVLIPKDQNEREIFLRAAKWVPETDRLCYAVSNEAGRQTSRPVLIKVRKTAGQVAQLTETSAD